MKQYVQTDLEADRQVANTLAELIIGGSLASSLSTPNRTTRGTRTRPREPYVYKSVYKPQAKAASLLERRPLSLVAGGGI